MQLCIKGIAEVRGNLMIAVYKNADEFPDFGKGDINIIHEVNSTSENIRIDDLLKGNTYAIAVYHDVNKISYWTRIFLVCPLNDMGFRMTHEALLDHHIFRKPLSGQQTEKD